MAGQIDGWSEPLEKFHADPVIQAVHSVNWDALQTALVVEFEAVSPKGDIRQRLLALQPAAAQALHELLGQALAETDTAEQTRQ